MKIHKTQAAAQRSNSRGIALVTTLLLISLMIAMTLAMVIAVSSDSLITRYYRNFRASFYAADSGANVARQYIFDQLQANITTTSLALNTAPIQGSTLLSTIQSSALSLYGSSGATANRKVNAGQGANSWPGSFQLSSICLGSYTTPCSPPSTNPNYATFCQTNNSSPCTAPTSNPSEYYYCIPYTLTSVGQSLANEQTTVTDSGCLHLSVPVAPGSTNLSFSAWGTFLDQYAECSSPFAPGTLTGPFFTNGAWTFEPGSYTFTGKVSSVSNTFGYYFNSGCVDSSSSSDKVNGTTIAPSFEDGYQLGAAAIALPTNDFNQKEAVVDGLGNSWATANGGSGETAAQQDALMDASLKTVDGNATPYPTAGTTNPGVYLPFTQTTSGTTTTNTMTGGGIYVEGSASVEVTASTVGTGTSSTPVQVLTITQGTSPNTTVTTITLNNTANTTTVSQAVTTQNCTTTHGRTTCTNSTATSTTNISGVPENLTGATPTPATMLYVDGNITSLSGPGQGVAGIQNGYNMTITAADNVVVTGDVLYASEPVTTTQNQNVGGVTYPTVDTLIPNSGAGILGIFTATGDVQMNNSQSNGNIELDASIAMISQGGSGGWTGTSGNNINTVTLVGGRVANQAMACYCTTRNLYFDQRFANGTVAPPWFPASTISTGSDTVDPWTATTLRTGWVVQNY